MNLIVPDLVPVAAESLSALKMLGHAQPLDQKQTSLVIMTNDETDRYSVWVSPSLSNRSCRSAWSKAAQSKFVDEIGAWGDHVDIDHVFPKSWASVPSIKIEYVRLFPVWAEVNRQAGGGREKHALKIGVSAPRTRGIVFAEQLQILKIIGHKVGSVSAPEKPFD